jgi:hypothetical protein
MKLYLKYTLIQAITAILVLSGTTHLWAGDAIKVINPPAEFQAFHAAAPESLQRGTLNAIDKKGATIDGTYRRFSVAASLLSYYGKPMKKARFVSGIPVGFRENPAGEIIAIWDLRPEMSMIP